MINPISIAITSHFDSAHRISNYDGKCQFLHGHRWLYEVELEMSVDPHTGMAIDFKTLKATCKATIEEILDHGFLNDTIAQPTAENVCKWIFDKLCPVYHGELKKVSLWETPECRVSLTSSQYEQYK